MRFTHTHTLAFTFNWVATLGLSCCLILVSTSINAANIAYIHGDVSAKGTVPASAETLGSTSAYDQMLLNDTGNKGLSEFAQMVQQQGHIINQHYDQSVNLTSAWLSDKQIVIFGLHQKLWSSAEKTALRNWLNAGGGILIYSDSASGGCYCEVGAQNPVGQMVTNNLISEYGMQVTVDQADGTTAHTALNVTSIAGISGKTLEGEGVSPIAVSANSSDVEVLIPYNRNVRHSENISIANPEYAALVLRPVGNGSIAVMFDRQPMWNSGPGSDINKRDNKEILRSLINAIAQPPPSTDPTPISNIDAIIVPTVMLLFDGDN